MDERRVCRYYNTPAGCLYGSNCKFAHYSKRPTCKYFGLGNGCRFGNRCQFTHDLSGPVRQNGNIDELGQYSETNNSSSGFVRNQTTAKPKLNDNVEIKVLNEKEIQCGVCKTVLRRQEDESFCNLSKDHFLSRFIEKDVKHIEYVGRLASSNGNTDAFCCKTCGLTFELPWLLFRHAADKTKSVRAQYWLRKIHVEWLDTVAGLMAGYDLGLFSVEKTQNELAYLLHDNDLSRDKANMFATSALSLLRLFDPNCCVAAGDQLSVSQQQQQQQQQMLLQGLMHLDVSRGDTSYHGRGGRGGHFQGGNTSGGSRTAYRRTQGDATAALSHHIVSSAGDMCAAISEEEDEDECASIVINEADCPVGSAGDDKIADVLKLETMDKDVPAVVFADPESACSQ